LVPINFRLHPKECAFIMEHSEARAVIVSPESNNAIVEIRGQMPKVCCIISTRERRIL
jgi:long-subunit acyl-CoA synthetase (AMP-forming)